MSRQYLRELGSFLHPLPIPLNVHHFMLAEIAFPIYLVIHPSSINLSHFEQVWFNASTNLLVTRKSSSFMNKLESSNSNSHPQDTSFLTSLNWEDGA